MFLLVTSDFDQRKRQGSQGDCCCFFTMSQESRSHEVTVIFLTTYLNIYSYISLPRTARYNVYDAFFVPLVPNLAYVYYLNNQHIICKPASLYAYIIWIKNLLQLLCSKERKKTLNGDCILLSYSLLWSHFFGKLGTIAPSLFLT
jgi:hypothetical protein